MRTMEWMPQERTAAVSPERRRHYALLVDDIEVDGFHCESYGLMVRDVDTGEETAVRHITVNSAQALALLSRVARLAVSPVALRDVVEDYLGE